LREEAARLLVYYLDTGQPKPVSRHSQSVDALPPAEYLEPTETVAQAPRFVRHLIDKRRHVIDLTDVEAEIYEWCKSHIMRNPDPWRLPDGEPDPKAARRAGLIGLVMVVLLILGGLLLTRILADMTRLQDCALSGRSNCSTN
jgi:hypothetical protein